MVHRQRDLTPIQWEVLSRSMRGERPVDIAFDLALHPKTVQRKLTAIRKGMAKGAYRVLPAPETDPQLRLL